VLRRAVGGVVVSEDSFPVDPIEQPIEPVDQRADIVALVKRRNDNSEVWPASRGFPRDAVRARGSRSGLSNPAGLAGPVISLY
jgi:hypothetical protein